MIVDTHAYLSRWPFRRLAGDEPAAFAAKMRQQGVGQAWVGSFDGLLHRDIAAVNSRLAEDCRAQGAGLLVAFGSVNPNLPDWREDVRRCREQHHMPGIRLHPNYHGYTLADPQFREVLEVASRSGLIVQLVVTMEDERTQHPLMQVPSVDLRPLSAIVPGIAQLRLIVLNQRHDVPVKELAAAGQVYFDFAMVERVRGVANLAQHVSPQRVVFGSHFPLFNLESAILKMRESPLSNADAEAIREGNARRLLAAK
ncbi:MAG: amidohydrolase family protein [Acidobacteriota bacterium]